MVLVVHKREPVVTLSSAKKRVRASRTTSLMVTLRTTDDLFSASRSIASASKCDSSTEIRRPRRGNGLLLMTERIVPTPDARVNTFLTKVEQSGSVGRWYLGPLLKQLRGDMSQAELARRIGWSRERISQLEGGRTPWPSVETFNALARELNVPVTTLLRAAGADIPEERDEELIWIISQLNERGRELLRTLGHALLPEYRDRPGTGGE